MGSAGQSTSNTVTNTNGTTNATGLVNTATNGATTGSQSQASAAGFGSATAPTIQSILSTLNPLVSGSGLTTPEQTAIQQLTANGQAGNPYAPAIGNTASTLLSGGGATSQNGNLTSNLGDLKTNIGGIAAPGYSTVNSPEVQAALQAANRDVTDQVNGQFAAAGRGGSGYNTETLARGIASADAPIILNQANTDTANRLNAANTLYGAGNTTSGAITGNNQTALANEQNGINAATSAIGANNQGAEATIAAQELAKSLPASNLGLLAQIGIPIAGLNTTNSATGTNAGNTSNTGTIANTNSSQTVGTQNANTTATPSLLQDITSLGGLFSAPAGGVSAAAGLGQAAAGLGSAASSGLGSLARLFGL